MKLTLPLPETEQSFTIQNLGPHDLVIETNPGEEIVVKDQVTLFSSVRMGEEQVLWVASTPGPPGRMPE